MAPTAAPKTPAQRLIELSSETRLLEINLEEKQAQLNQAIRDLSRYHSFQHTSFGGVPMAQYWCDLMLWESVLNSNPEMKGIIEIGTWQGGFSNWLWAQTVVRGMSFATYDSIPPERETKCFRRLDVFASPKVVEKMIQEISEPLVLFCDGGNKPRELRTFGPMLQDPRSLVAVHDWGTETQPQDVPVFLAEEYGKYCDELGSVTRFFRAA